MTPRRRVPTGLSGVLVVNKPKGITSHDVVSRLRRSTGERRIGHAGTLDPMATGVLVVLVGPATRLAPYFTAAEKSYLARVVFGSGTDTDDAEGSVIVSAPVADTLARESVARQAVARIAGTRLQVPPAYSAIQRSGVRAHMAARSGAPFPVEPRSVVISRADFVGMCVEDAVSWDIALTVSKGTYVRAIARDLGVDMGTVAHLGALVRTASGPIGLAGAHSLEMIESHGPDVGSLFIDPVDAIGIPSFALSRSELARICNGASLDTERFSDGPIVLCDDTRLIAIHEWDAKRQSYRPGVVIPGGVAR